MIKTLRSVAALGFAVCLMISRANAVMITVDPDDYAPGTNLSFMVPGVSLVAFSSPSPGQGSSYVISSVYAAHDPTCETVPDDCLAVTGSNVFSRSSDPIYIHGAAAWFDSPAATRCLQYYPLFSCASDNFATLLITFMNPTDYVEISGAYRIDAPLLYAYDASHNLIGGGGSLGPQRNPQIDGNYLVSTPQFQSSSANISYVIAAGWSAISSLDALRYNDMTQSVPEPGTGLLFALGIAGIVVVQRKTKGPGEVHGEPPTARRS